MSEHRSDDGARSAAIGHLATVNAVLALVIDTSSAAVTAGVVELTADAPPRVLAERVIVDGRAHGELLAPSLQACFSEAGVTVAQLGAVIAGLGPGPFTGLRVGLVTAAAFADATGLPSYGVCSLDAIAAVHPDQPSLLVAGDARRKEIYWASYENGIRQDGPDVAKPAAVTASGTMVGAGARLYEAVLNLPLLQGDYPTVAGLAAVAAERVLTHAASEVLTPLYLRRPDAVVPGAVKAVN